jgi:hypothetical protein
MPAVELTAALTRNPMTEPIHTGAVAAPSTRDL